MLHVFAQSAKTQTQKLQVTIWLYLCKVEPAEVLKVFEEISR